VAGGSASGKSTVCEKIMENLRNNIRCIPYVCDFLVFMLLTLFDKNVRLNALA
jgi:hypothetical protein